MESSNFNPIEWLPGKQEAIKNLQGSDDTTIEMDIERVVSAIEASCTDLTANYQDWINIGFGLVNELGEMGRSYFHRISGFHPGYSLTETDKKYDSFLKGNSQGTTIKTFFYLAKQAGIEIAGERPVLQPQQKMATEKDETLSEEAIEFKTPQLPDQIYENLPRILTESTRLFADGIERDIFFLSALTVLSSCLPQLEGMYFNRNLSPHLYLFITGPSASGKGNDDLVPVPARGHS